MSLGDWFIVSIDYLPYLLWCDQKGWNRRRWVVMYTHRVKTARLVQTALGNSHLTSSMQCSIIS